MQQYQAGDYEAFATLYGRHKGSLFRYVLRQLGHQHESEEIFQDVWQSVISARDRYQPSASFKVYLYTIARNRVIDYYRRHRILDAANSIDPVCEPEANSSEQPDEKADNQAAINHLKHLVSELPDHQREAFLLKEEAGLNLEDIASTTGVGKDTAKSRLRYAYQKLRQGLESYV